MFRDIKNPQLGQSLSESKKQSTRRFEMLLMIEYLACWLLHLIGRSAQQRQMTLLFQSTCRIWAKKFPSLLWLAGISTTIYSGLFFLFSKMALMANP
jgi:hypothetical protein